MPYRFLPFASLGFSFGLLCCVSSRGFGQNAVSTGTHAGFRMYYPNSNDWWIDPSKGSFDIRANGLPAVVTLNAVGKLGIGTTNPGAQLDVQTPTAGIYAGSFQNSIYSGKGVLIRGGANGYYNALDIQDYNTNPLVTVSGAGNVGIGTTGPASKLEINAGSVGANALMLRNTGLYTSLIGKGNASADTNAADATSVLSLGTLGGNSLVTQGNVGIGTPSPTTTLDVAGNIRLKNSLTFAQNGNLATYLGLGGYITGGWSTAPNAWTITPNQQDFAVGGWAKTGGLWTGPWLFINSDSGNVGIGTTGPTSKLDIAGSDGLNAFQIKNPVGNSIRHALGLDASDNANFAMTNSGGATVVSLNTAGASYLNGGNVGIGTASPTTGKLVVSGGNIDMTGNRIINLPTAIPIAATDAATKGYVDASIGGKTTFAGQTTAAYQGGSLGGYPGANAKCQLQFAGSHFCSYQEYRQTGDTGSPTCWINDDTTALAAYGNVWWNCGTSYGVSAWNGGGAQDGYQLAAGQMSYAGCTDVKGLCCCK